MEAQILLKMGAVRRVGSGNNIDIVKDPWLPNTQDPYVHSLHPALVGNKVSSLMMEDQNEWDVDLTNDIFDDRDVILFFRSIFVEQMRIHGIGIKRNWVLTL